jgi:hypothetical protein
MRRVANIPVLLAMAAVASPASATTPVVRDAHVWGKDRIISAANLPVAVKRLSPTRNAAQPLPAVTADPTPFITEFYGPAKPSPVAKPRSVPAVGPEAVILRSSRRQSR